MGRAHRYWLERRTEDGDFIVGTVANKKPDAPVHVLAFLCEELADVEGAPEEFAATVRWAMRKRVKLDSGGENELVLTDE